MGIFYLDMEYTNGNLYLCEIFDIALLSQRSGNIYQSYIDIRPEKIPRFIKKLCNINEWTLYCKSKPFLTVINELLTFIRNEEGELYDREETMIIGHGSFYNDYPILLAQCMKNRYPYESELHHFTFIDSMLILRDKGYSKPGLDALSGISNRLHGAEYDVRLLQTVVQKLLHYDDLIERHAYTLDDIHEYMKERLPISINDIQVLAKKAKSCDDLEIILYKYCSKNSALNKKQVYKIAAKYFISS